MSQLNCHTGDVATVNWPGKTAHNHFVTVKEFIPPGTPCMVAGKNYRGSTEPAWWVECATEIRASTGDMITRFPVQDKRLRPHRHPGDDAVDQTLVHHPVPAITKNLTGAKS